ncbi:MAG TPA: aspartyl/asparaginyl beta-hydroxylase domain-containing protein [Labilithrix sp.]|nr:aspartyl/asparaginyl beta-hydroxylase domain-containing protein [Labilithrix sp.]
MDEARLSDDEVGLVADRMWSELRERLPEAGLSRIRGLLDVLARRVEPRLQEKQGTQGRWYMPDLPSSAWLSRASFERLASTLEALHPDLRRELLAAESEGAFRPYGYTFDEPDVRQDWVPAGWDELRLWQDFKPTEAVLRMPVAARALRAVVETSSLVNHVAFLAMKPGTHLPPHHDRTNWYVSVHMGIVVPPGCGLRVGDDERGWEEGKCIAFDNSFLHEAWNKGDARRLVLAVYLAHPLTTAVEREALRRLQLRYQSLAALGHEATIAWARSGHRPDTAQS